MAKARIVGVVAMSAAIVAAASGMAAQAPAPIAPNATLEALLSEVRGLRADSAQAASSSMRMQLLVARLSLQEQRIASLGRQSVDVQKQWQALAQERTQTEAVLKQIQGVFPPASAGRPDSDAPPSVGLDVLKLKVSQLRQQEEQLRVQEAELSSAIAGEQGRWAEFNSRLDELERSLTPIPRR